MVGALQHPFRLAEQPEIDLNWLLELATMAIVDADGTVRVGGAEILSRIVREVPGTEIAQRSRELLQQLQSVKTIVLLPLRNGLQSR